MIFGKSIFKPIVSRWKCQKSAGRRARAIYVVSMTSLLVLLTNLWVRDLNTDLLTVAQNQRVMFVEPRGADDPLYSLIPVNNQHRLSIFFIGNSQSYAIMDFVPGDRSMIPLLSEILNGGEETASSKFPVRFGSEANLRMSELLVKSVSAAVNSQRRPDVVVGGIVLDGLRWVDARTVIAQQCRLPPIRQELDNLMKAASDLPLAVRAIESMSAVPRAQTGVSSEPKSASLLEQSPLPGKVEVWIQSKLEDIFPLFLKRKKLFGYTAAKYQGIRDALFRINTATRRPITPEMYRINLQLIEITLKYLREQRVHPILYFAPIRPVEPNPYDQADVARFRHDLLALCGRMDAQCFDYSNLIPEEMWTNYPDDYYVPGQGGQRDFAHFTGRAHRKIAEQLASDSLPHLRIWLSEKSQ